MRRSRSDPTRMQRNPLDQLATPSRKFNPLVVVVFIILAIVGWLVFGRNSSGGYTYGVTFDAGSTGSRVHVYRFDANGKLLDEVFEQVKPGLSGHHKAGADARKAAESLKPLLDIAAAKVPKALQSCTPIALRATAGLRQLGRDKADELLEAVRGLFKEYPFAMAPDAVAIMDGLDEGVFAWVTVNYLLDKLGKDTTATIMDMGGASTQIVFNPSIDSMKSAPAESRQKFPYQGMNYNLYKNSYDMFGLMRAREKIIIKGKQDGKHVCLPKGVSKTFSIEGTDVKLESGSPSWSDCYDVAKGILNLDKCTETHCSFNGVFQPNLGDKSVFSGPIYAFSYFYDRSQIDGKQPEITVGTFKEMGEKACAADTSDEDHEMQCMDLAYLYAILRNGYHVDDSTQLNIHKKINGIETQWTLGATLQFREKQPACPV
eukprot:TRINITY_DN52735_c0_g1_i1.p1 TRINITY_DN52735_c0_g1~~TRINITY_DN52735_c0_g1_i1.p1  ORF type:complete len:431 (-),score=38.86 TRINITY_DN52735_c0_g1_i1:117-1409(-)